MILSFSSLSFALSLFSLAQAGDLAEDGDTIQADVVGRAGSLPQTGDILGAHGYEAEVWQDVFFVYSLGYEEGCEFMDAMTFHPNQKAATIYMTRNDDEPDHENKLSLTEIYNALAKRKGTEPGEMRVVTFEVELADKETNGLIAGIRKDRNLGPFEEIKILPGAEEWDMIATTQYYAKLLQVVNRPIQKIVIRNRDHFSQLSEVTHINRISFSLAPLENKTPVPGTATEVSAAEVQAEFDDEEQEAALEALFATDEESRDLFQAEIGRKCASRISDADSDV